MNIRFIPTIALVCCFGGISALAGCAPEENGSLTEDGDESVAVATDSPAQPALETEDWNGQCCHWTCSNNHPHASHNPSTYGACQSYARYWCIEHGQGNFIEGTADWNTCVGVD